MKRMLLMSVFLALGLVGPTGLASASGERAQDERATVGQAFQERFSGTRLSFTPQAGLSNFTLRVSGPEGYEGQVFSARVAPTFRLGDHGTVVDGRYSYEITAATQQRQSRANLPAAGSNGRDGVSRAPLVGVSQNGRFQVVNGRITPFDSEATEGSD